MANLNKYDKLHADNISAYERQIKEIYDTAIKEAAAIGASIDKFNPDKMFTFNDYPQTKKKINNLINKLNHNVNVSIGNGIKSGWDLSNAKNDMLVSNCFSKTNAKIFTSIKEMPGELQEAVKEYTEMLSHHVNRYLRDNKIINKSKHDRVLETIKGLDEAFSNTKLEKGTYYRGLQFLKKEDKEKYIEQLKKGDFTDKGYSSTTKKLEVAKDFAEGKNGVVLKINGEGLNLSGETFYEEEEVLINRNSKFKVDKIYEKEGVTYAELTQITQKQKLLSEKDKVRLFARNIEAQNAFMKRKVNGLSLSDRVWRYSKQFKGEIELALDIGIREGKSAAELSRDLRKYLQRPDDLFRRVRDEHGILRLSKRAASFHPGVGVYRSSYKNAMRLARTEINMAYRTADHLRWQQMDFVVGIEVRRSNRKYDCVVCESLAGKYPKDFKFTGWHPQCRCHTVSILSTEAEFIEQQKAILEGREGEVKSRNTVDSVPTNFTNWLQENRERIENAKAKPLWMIENRNFIDNQSQPLVSFVKAKSAKEAEEWVTKNIPFIKSADYSGISRNDANRLNEHLTYLQNKGFMKGSDGTIKLVPFRGKVSDPVGGGYQMLKHGQKDARLRIDVWSDKKFKALEKKAEKQVEKQFKKVVANWEAALATIENDLAAYYKDPAMEKMTWGDDRLDVLLKRKKAIKDLMEKDIASFKANRANKMKRAMDFVSNVSENMEDNLTHEMGHALNANLQTNYHAYSSEVRSLLKRMKKKYDYYPDREGIIFEKDSNLFDKSMLEYGLKVSEYACTNGAEYFAESFTMFMKGKELPDKELEKLFKLIVRQ